MAKIEAMIKKDIQQNQIKFLKSVGENIKKYRKKQGLSQQELGYRCNIDKPHISRAESGRHNFSILMALRISEGLGINPMELFNFDYKDFK